MKRNNIIIIGAGPNGLYASKKLQDQFKGWEIICIDKGNVANNINQYPDVVWHSEMSNLFLPSKINDKIKAHHQPTSNELVNYYRFFSKEHDIKIYPNHEVINVTKEKNKTIVQTNHNGKHFFFFTNYLIVATGIFSNKKQLKFPSLPNYCTYNLKVNHKNKNLVLIGGGNSATDFIANNLKDNKIHWIIRKDNWKIFYNVKHTFDHVKEKYNKNLKVYFNTEVEEFKENKTIKLSNSVLITDIDLCTILIGFQPYSEQLKKWGLDFKNNCLVMDENNETNIQKVYALGSVASRWSNKEQKINQTFVMNGNKEVLGKIIDSILIHESEEIFDLERDSFIDLYPKKPLIKKILDKILTVGK